MILYIELSCLIQVYLFLINFLLFIIKKNSTAAMPFRAIYIHGCGPLLHAKKFQIADISIYSLAFSRFPVFSPSAYQPLTLHSNLLPLVCFWMGNQITNNVGIVQTALNRRHCLPMGQWTSGPKSVQGVFLLLLTHFQKHFGS